MALTLLFKIDKATYGLEIDLIQEIMESPALFYAPKAKGLLKGSINFHGQILSVVDLAELLDSTEEDRDHRHLVLTKEARSMVLQVNDIERIVNLDTALLEPPPPESGAKAVREVAELEEAPVYLLDIDEVIDQLEKTFAEKED